MPANDHCAIQVLGLITSNKGGLWWQYLFIASEGMFGGKV